MKRGIPCQSYSRSSIASPASTATRIDAFLNTLAEAGLVPTPRHDGPRNEWHNIQHTVSQSGTRTIVTSEDGEKVARFHDGEFVSGDPEYAEQLSNLGISQGSPDNLK